MRSANYLVVGHHHIIIIIIFISYNKYNIYMGAFTM